jgi:hypothetical protein
VRGVSIRLVTATLLFSAWFVSLLLGFAFGGAVHLLLLGALIAFPWRHALGSGEPAE